VCIPSTPSSYVGVSYIKHRREATTRLRNREVKETVRDAFELKVPTHLREVYQC